LIDPNESEGVLLKMTKFIEALPDYEVEEDEGNQEESKVSKQRSKQSSKRRSSRESSGYIRDTNTIKNSKMKESSVDSKNNRSNSSKDRTL